MKTISPIIVEGDLIDQPVEIIVNAWNRNIISWWLLLPQGVSGAIKKRTGYKPFFALGKVGPIPLSGAVLTTASNLNYRGIIHVAGINMLWRSTKDSIKQFVVSAMRIVNGQQFESVAFPIIGAGTGGFGDEGALLLMQEAIQKIESSAKVLFVKFRGY